MNELETLENMLNELLSALQEVLSSGETLTDDFQLVLAEELQYLTGRIDELRAQAIPTPEIPSAPYPSSNISGFKYDPKNKRMLVQFLDKYPNRNGPKYAYENVDPFIFEVIKRGAVAPKTSGKNRYHSWVRGVTPSLGASVYHLLKMGNYPYRRLT